jgi:hypothetical protein
VATQRDGVLEGCAGDVLDDPRLGLIGEAFTDGGDEVCEYAWQGGEAWMASYPSSGNVIASASTNSNG